MGEKLLNCVYRFKDINGEIIYIGSAKILEGRIKGLEHTTKHLADKAYKEVKLIQYISFDTENDARFAERYLIQKHRPKYNTKLADKPISLNMDDVDKKEWDIYEFDESTIKTLIENFKKEKLKHIPDRKPYLVLKIKENFQDVVYFLACYPAFAELEKENYDNENVKNLRDIQSRVTSKIKDAFIKEIDDYKLLSSGFRASIYVDHLTKKKTTLIDFSKTHVGIKKSAFILQGKIGVCGLEFCDVCKNKSCNRKEYEFKFPIYVKCE